VCPVDNPDCLNPPPKPKLSPAPMPLCPPDNPDCLPKPKAAPVQSELK
jgi:hypothetical protein